jgi:hypothetical protein
LAVPVPLLVGSEAVTAGFKACGSDARAVAASPVGRKSGPRCPHAASSNSAAVATTRAVACVLPRMGTTFNIGKL